MVIDSRRQKATGGSRRAAAKSSSPIPHSTRSATAAAAAAHRGHVGHRNHHDNEDDEDPENEEEEDEEEEEEDDDSEDVTRCICGKGRKWNTISHGFRGLRGSGVTLECDLTFFNWGVDDNGTMVQCEQCRVWQHTACMLLDDDELPEHYYCEECHPNDHNLLLNGKKRPGDVSPSHPLYPPYPSSSKRNRFGKDFPVIFLFFLFFSFSGESLNSLLLIDRGALIMIKIV